MAALGPTEGHADEHISAPQPGQEHQHPSSAVAHVTGQEEPQTPGSGKHQTTAEDHHLSEVSDNMRRLPSHELEPQVTAPLPESVNSSTTIDH